MGKIRIDRFRQAVVVLALLAAFVVGCYVGPTVAYQPHMENALGALRQARSELAASEPNKGGFREQAIGLVDQAIAATEKGISYAGD
jgi:hypothetical protein